MEGAARLIYTMKLFMYQSLDLPKKDAETNKKACTVALPYRL